MLRTCGLRFGPARSSLFAPTGVALQRLTSHSPYLRRPTQLNRNAASGHFTSRARHKAAGDPTMTSPSSHLLLFRCPHCKRVRHVHMGMRDYQQVCCEGRVMREITSAEKAVNLYHNLTKIVRTYDPVRMQPRSKGHKPASKHRSKLPS